MCFSGFLVESQEKIPKIKKIQKNHNKVKKKEREKNADSEKAVHESMKLSQIEEKVRNLINLVDQLEQK